MCAYIFSKFCSQRREIRKTKKEIKVLEVTDEIGILEQNDIEKAFYEEQPKRDLGYRRGISL